MFNIRLSTIVACVAFILSLLIGIMSKSYFPALILRPLAFGVLFFVLSAAITLLVSRFLPELLEKDDYSEGPLPGSRINITEESAAVPGGMYARPNDSDEDLGNISELVHVSASSSVSDSQEALGMPGMDQMEKNGYAEEGILDSAPESEDSFDALPDLESLAGAFIPDTGPSKEVIPEYVSTDAPRRTKTGNRAQKMDSDFDPKDLAAGIRTILKKEEG